MFIHVVKIGNFVSPSEKNDTHSRTECKYYSAMTKNSGQYQTKDDHFQMIFFAETHRKGEVREMQVDKRTHVVYIESDSGKTIDTYRWKIDEERNNAIRI